MEDRNNKRRVLAGDTVIIQGDTKDDTKYITNLIKKDYQTESTLNIDRSFHYLLKQEPFLVGLVIKINDTIAKVMLAGHSNRLFTLDTKYLTFYYRNIQDFVQESLNCDTHYLKEFLKTENVDIMDLLNSGRNCDGKDNHLGVYRKVNHKVGCEVNDVGYTFK